MKKMFSLFLIFTLAGFLAGCATPLTDAVRRGDIQQVKALLDSGADINEAGGDPACTPLEWAIKTRNLDTVKVLIERGADINASSGYYTPLIRAVQVGDIAFVSFLIEKGANVNHSSRYFGTPLMWAAAHKKTAIVDLLLEKGADLEYALIECEADRRWNFGSSFVKPCLETLKAIKAKQEDKIAHQKQKEQEIDRAKETEVLKAKEVKDSIKEVLKVAVWDLAAGNLTPSYAQDLTSILVSEISKLKKYEVYSQENVRTLAGWTAERMTLGCTDTKCLTALGQMDIAKLISGRVGKIGNTYSISLNLFDTQNARAEGSVSEFCQSEDQLINLVQMTARKLLGAEVVSVKAAQPPSATALPAPIPPSPVAASPAVKPKTEIFAGTVDTYIRGEKIKVVGRKEGSNTERYYMEFAIAPNASLSGAIVKRASVRVFYYEQDGKPIATEIRAIMVKQ